MEQTNKEINIQKTQEIILLDKSKLSISGTDKIISLKPELIQLKTNFGTVAIIGNNLELINLNNTSNTANIIGNVNTIKFVDSNKKENIFGKLFKWFFIH